MLKDAYTRELCVAEEVHVGSARRSPMFEFAMALKPYPEFADLSADNVFDMACQVLGDDWWEELDSELPGCYEDPRAALALAWSRPVFAGTLDLAVERAHAEPYPGEVPGMASDTARRFLAIVWHLQRLSGTAPILIPINTFASLLGVSKMSISNYRMLLVRMNVLELVEEGDHGSGRAGRYRFLPVNAHRTETGFTNRSDGAIGLTANDRREKQTGSTAVNNSRQNEQKRRYHHQDK